MMVGRQWGMRLGLLALVAVLALAGAADAELIGYWPLDGDGAAAVGTGGVLVNGPTATTDRNGAAGGALAFASTGPSSGSYVAIPGGGGLDGASTATVSLWVQWNGTQDNGWGNRNGAVMGRQNNGLWSDDVLCIYSGTDPNTSIINWEARVGAGINSGVQPGSGTWRHVAATATPAGEVLYVDGIARSTRAGPFAGHRSDPSIPLTIGAWIGDGASYSTSSIDDVAVWDQALSPGQVAALASQVVTPQTAGNLVKPVGAKASSEIPPGFRRQAANTVDGVGQATTTPDGWPSDAAGMWLSAAGDTTPTITFDLGGVHALDAAVVFNYNEGGGLTRRGVQQANLSISTDNVTYTPVGAGVLAEATGNAQNPGQAVALGGIEARYLRVDVVSNYGDGSYTGLNEVEFIGTPLEPMPIGGVAVTASSEIRPNFDRRAVHLVDGSGLFADAHSVVPDGLMWLSAGIGFGPVNDGDPELVFDLGRRHFIDSTQIWNYNEVAQFLGRGVNGLEVSISHDGVTYSPVATANLAIAPGVDGVDFSESIDLDHVGARYVKFDILSNHNGVSFPAGGGPDAAFVGLSEVRFFGEEVPQIGPVSARASTELIAGFNRRAANVVDGVGQTTTDPDGWPSDADGMWLSNGTFRSPNDTDPEITFDLGGIHQLDSFTLYNYNEATAGLSTRGVRDAEVFVSTDNVTYTSLGVQTFAKGTGDATNPGQVVAFSDVQARYLRLDVLSTHGGDNSFAGLGEVEFFGVALEPMPISGVSVSASSSLFQGSFDRRAVHLIDGTGLFADGHSVGPDGAMWLSGGIGFGATSDGNPELIFDLGGDYFVDAAQIWNYNEMLPGRADLLRRGVQQVEVLASLDGLSFTPLGVFDLAIAPGVDGVDFSETIGLGGASARFIKFDILSNHNGVVFPATGGADNAFVGLSEVQFFGKLIPEPATLALLAGGLLAMVRRRRKK